MLGKPVGDFEGDVVGDLLTLGDSDGDVVGELLGEFDGDVVGDLLGDPLGEFDGDIVGDHRTTMEQWNKLILVSQI